MEPLRDWPASQEGITPFPTSEKRTTSQWMLVPKCPFFRGSPTVLWEVGGGVTVTIYVVCEWLHLIYVQAIAFSGPVIHVCPPSNMAAMASQLWHHVQAYPASKAFCRTTNS